MAINQSAALLKLSGNQQTNSDGKPRMLLCRNTAIETVNGNHEARVLVLGFNDGFYYGDLQVSNNPTVPSKHADVLVSDRLDYEISFWFWQPTDGPSIELYVTGKNKYGYPTQMHDIRNQIIYNYFLNYPERPCGTPGRWHFARFVLYATNVADVERGFLNAQPLTSLGVGTNLYMGKGTAYINLRLRNLSNLLKLYNFIIKPLRTPFSTGYLQGGDIIELWRKVNNKSITESEINRIAQQKLLPYNVAQATITL